MKYFLQYKNFLVFFTMVIICFCLSVFCRFHQYTTWKENYKEFFVKDIPLMTTADAYLFIKEAKDLQKTEIKRLSDYFSYTMLSVILSKLSFLFDNNIYKTGILIIPVLSSLFIIPLCLYFFYIRYPACGILGTLFGSFGFIYLIRTSIGRVDNDMLNLFFTFLISFFILLLNTKHSKMHILYICMFSALAGLLLSLFQWWYAKIIFTILYFLAFFIFVFINKLHIKDILFSGTVFTIFSSLLSYDSIIKFFNTYITWLHIIILLIICICLVVIIKTQKIHLILQKTIKNNILRQSLYIVIFIIIMLLIFKHFYKHEYLYIISIYIQQYLNPSKEQQIVSASISELAHNSIKNTLSSIYGSPIVAICGIAFFLIFLVYNYKKLVPIMPIFIIGCISFFSSTRFLMYLSPFVGIGYGYCITKCLNFIFNFFKSKIQMKNYIKDIITYVCSFSLFFMVYPPTFLSYIPTPVVPADIYSNFLNLKDKLPLNSNIYTWWDFGYAIKDIGFRVFHAGGFPAVNIAHSFISTDQTELYNTINSYTSDNSTYVIFTRDMIYKFNSIYAIGLTGASNKLFNNQVVLLPTLCEYMGNNTMSCDGAFTINLNEGYIQNNNLSEIVILNKIIIINNNKVVREIDYKRNLGAYVEIIDENSQSFITLIFTNEEAFNSNFNQMYLLGKYDTNMYELIYNAFPSTIVFKRLIKQP